MRKEQIQFEWYVFLDSLGGDIQTTISAEAVEEEDPGGGYLYYIDTKWISVEIEPGFEQYRPEIVSAILEDEDLCEKARSHFE